MARSAIVAEREIGSTDNDVHTPRHVIPTVYFYVAHAWQRQGPLPNDAGFFFGRCRYLTSQCSRDPSIK
eukprot:scaffold16412_cov171-Amphora_coffeaeformis.AAC.2